MLGNFSFGDYFKREAIHWAWEFLTDKKWLGLDPDRLTRHRSISTTTRRRTSGTTTSSCRPTAFERMGEDDNFWPAGAPSKGPDGVCGPCSEIFYHRPTASEVEIWNLVFTQFNRVGDPPNNLRPLPSKNIDTGMGLERMAAVLQGVDTNFHIDILRPLVEAAGEVCGVKYDPTSDNGRRLRRIADHVRACTFAIHEERLSGPEQAEVRHQAAAAPRGARRPSDGRARAVPAQARADGRRVMQQAVSRTERNRRRACRKVIESEEEQLLRARSTPGSNRIERLFDDMKYDRPRRSSPATKRPRCTPPTAFRPNCSRRMPPSTICSFDWAGFQPGDGRARHGIAAAASDGAVSRTARSTR